MPMRSVAAFGAEAGRRPSGPSGGGRGRPAPAPWWAVVGGTRAEQVRFGLAILLILAIAALGGAARADVIGLLLLRPLTVIIAAVLLCVPGSLAWPILRAPAKLLGWLAVTIAIQLVPLPPALVLALPGHQLFREAAAAAGVPQSWRPLTISPDMTLNSLVALIIPAAVLIAGASLRRDQRHALLPMALGLAALSAAIGLFQIADEGPYFYALTNAGRPVGLFANINHQATLLAASLPLTAAWAIGGRHRLNATRLLIGIGLGAFLLVAVVVGGSRGGVLLAALGLLLTPFIITDRLPLGRRGRLILLASGGALVAALMLAAWVTGRTVGFDRLLATSANDVDPRLAFLPFTLELVRRYFPFGSGWGTFDPAFRGVEPDRILTGSYFNHAHNDLVELLLTGGLPSLLVLLAFLVWLGRRAWTVFRFTAAPGTMLARAGVASAVVLLAASVIDYPLRTPLAAALLALASLWAAETTVTAGDEGQRLRGDTSLAMRRPTEFPA